MFVVEPVERGQLPTEATIYVSPWVTLIVRFDCMYVHVYIHLSKLHGLMAIV